MVYYLHFKHYGKITSGSVLCDICSKSRFIQRPYQQSKAHLLFNEKNERKQWQQKLDMFYHFSTKSPE
jgi:hypothetical protein